MIQMLSRYKGAKISTVGNVATIKRGNVLAREFGKTAVDAHCRAFCKVDQILSYDCTRAIIE
jgi:hypothetical protein